MLRIRQGQDVVRDVMLAEMATKRFVKIEEIGGLAAFLCSDEAASLTGAALSVDGGWTALRGSRRCESLFWESRRIL
jgi:NAD(P)-dependent dehydrogenase (short-subunit alcohol dehydrogenase family)